MKHAEKTLYKPKDAIRSYLLEIEVLWFEMYDKCQCQMIVFDWAIVFSHLIIIFTRRHIKITNYIICGPPPRVRVTVGATRY